MSAVSMAVLGANEFAERLPALLLSVLTVLLVARLARARNGADGAVTPALILSGSLGFFICAGTVMTDPGLAFSVTLILTSFWLALRGEGRIWGWLFFVGCGIGLLAKGPIALVLAGLPVFFWTLRRREWRRLWERLPWVRGGVLTLAIALPWYVLAEMRTPGFLKYFLIGEHFGRFLDKNWDGDRYGFAHEYPHGMIWIFALLSFLPWSFFLPAARKTWRDEDGWMLFLALWSLCGLIFFTAAANIIWPYPLPLLPGLALLLAESPRRRSIRVPVSSLAAITGIAGLIAPIAIAEIPQKFDASQRDIVHAWRAENPDEKGAFIFWPYKTPQFSAAFYTQGHARSVTDPQELRALLHNGARDFIACPVQDLDRLPPDVRAAFKEVGRYTNARGARALLREKKPG
jgi:4-amino-4-deoxy-L-arabinose transferase-like glycosyltransferase